MMYTAVRSLIASHGRPRHRKSHRPTLESLEARTVLSTLFVDVNDPTADDPGDNLYAQIQEAVDAASPGDKIMVHAGTYLPFTVGTDDLTIKAASDDSSPLVDATGQPIGVMILADGVTIQGLTVENADQFGVVVTGSHNTLRDNVANNNTAFGFGVVSVTGPPTSSFVGNALIGNTATGNSFSGFVIGGNEGGTLIGNVAVGNRTGFEISASNDSTITGNQAIGNEQLGFFVNGGTRNRLTGNVAVDGGLLGFQIGGTDGTITGNTASGNANAGFNIFRAQGHTLTGNVASDNGGTGFALNGSSGNTLRGNVSEGNVGSGFSLNPYVFSRVSIVSFPLRTAQLSFRAAEPSNDNTFQGNEATGNGEHGFYLRGASGNTFRGNTADANAGDGFRVETFHFVAPPRFGIFTLVNAGELLFSLPSDTNFLKGNTSTNNDGYGFYVDELLDNLTDDNEAEDNLLGDFNF